MLGCPGKPNVTEAPLDPKTTVLDKCNKHTSGMPIKVSIFKHIFRFHASSNSEMASTNYVFASC